MDKNVVAAIYADKSVAFLTVKPFDCSLHRRSPLQKVQTYLPNLPAFLAYHRRIKKSNDYNFYGLINYVIKGFNKLIVIIAIVALWSIKYDGVKHMSKL